MFGDFHETELRETMRDLPAVRFQTQEVFGTEFTICSYMISDPEIWNRKHGLECRGITFDDFGFIVCRPFEKFFNVNEVASTQEHLIKPLYEMEGTRLQEKRDGSMLTPVVIDDCLVFKTKKSFYSDVALRAQEFANTDEYFLEACKECVQEGWTPIFEFTSPESQIVIDYGSTPKFVLLAIRDTNTGNYVYPDSRLAKNPWKLFLGVEWIAEEVTDRPSWDHLMKIKDEVEGIEGWVIVLPNGQRVKLKTKWYMDRHRLIDLRYRDVAKMVINETLDDLKADALDRGLDLTVLNAIEDQVITEYRMIIEGIEKEEAEVLLALSKIGIHPDGTRDFWSRAAMTSKEMFPENFGLIMSKLRGKEIDYKEIWMDTYCKGYTLRSVYNANFGGDDAT